MLLSDWGCLRGASPLLVINFSLFFEGEGFTLQETKGMR
jgi:hypothetical protein